MCIVLGEVFCREITEFFPPNLPGDRELKDWVRQVCLTPISQENLQVELWGLNSTVKDTLFRNQFFLIGEVVGRVILGKIDAVFGCAPPTGTRSKWKRYRNEIPESISRSKIRKIDAVDMLLSTISIENLSQHVRILFSNVSGCVSLCRFDLTCFLGQGTGDQSREIARKFIEILIAFRGFFSADISFEQHVSRVLSSPEEIMQFLDAAYVAVMKMWLQKVADNFPEARSLLASLEEEERMRGSASALYGAFSAAKQLGLIFRQRFHYTFNSIAETCAGGLPWNPRDFIDCFVRAEEVPS